MIQAAQIDKGFECAPGLASGLSDSIKLTDVVIAAAHQCQDMPGFRLHDDNGPLNLLFRHFALQVRICVFQTHQTFCQGRFGGHLNLGVQAGVNRKPQAGEIFRAIQRVELFGQVIDKIGGFGIGDGKTESLDRLFQSVKKFGL